MMNPKLKSSFVYVGNIFRFYLFFYLAAIFYKFRLSLFTSAEPYESIYHVIPSCFSCSSSGLGIIYELVDTK